MHSKSKNSILNFSGLIDPSESLFTYPSGLSSTNFSFPDHLPLFVDEVVAGASQQVLDTCQANTRCIFDATQTGVLDIGIDSVKVDEINQEDQMFSG